MAKGKKTGGRDYKPGQSGNPNGRPPLPADIKLARAISQFEFERIANYLLGLTRQELRARMKSAETPAIELMVGRVVQSAVWSGDYRRLAFLLDRIVGRPKTQVEIVGNQTTESGTNEEDRAERLARLRKRIKQLEITDDENSD